MKVAMDDRNTGTTWLSKQSLQKYWVISQRPSEKAESHKLEDESML